MATDKARKRAVRTRMAKTGERYAAARRNVAKPAPLVTDDLGQSDDAIRNGSGRGWREWITILDAWGATGHTYPKIARYVRDELGVDGWWAQSVTVGYERARGMRAAHQRPDGFSVSVSKTFAVDVATLFRAFTQARSRNRWLEPGTSAFGRRSRRGRRGSTWATVRSGRRPGSPARDRDARASRSSSSGCRIGCGRTHAADVEGAAGKLDEVLTG
jgi:hypothetical protein